MPHDIFRELQQRLDTYSVGFPATESGIELKILEKLFTPEDVDLFMSMSQRLETPQQIAERLERNPGPIAEHLEDMTGRGLLFRLNKNGVSLYGAIPFIHGLFEFQVKRMDAELAGLTEQYFNEKNFEQTMFTSMGAFLRAIPVQRSVPVVHNVAAYEDAAEILRGVDQIVITDCACRKQHQALDAGCGKEMEACFMFGSMGQYYLDHDMGRRISLDEALAVLAKCQEQGLVTQPNTAQNPAGMCNCCGDCCGVLRILNKHPKPAEIVFSNYFAIVDAEECTGCETCLERCQMEAISLGDDDLAKVNTERCIGCGLCVTTCPSEAMGLESKAEAQRFKPPLNSGEQMRFMAQRRGLL